MGANWCLSIIQAILSPRKKVYLNKRKQLVSKKSAGYLL